MWTRRKTVIGGITAPDDWEVCLRGQPCGRVQRVFSAITADRTTWQWSALTYPGGHGRCDRLDDALEAVRATVLRDGGRLAGGGVLDMG
jgi:hypothetical protein